jgi:hypothetical protein
MHDTFTLRQGMPRPLLLALLGFGAGAAHAGHVSRDERRAAGRRKRSRLVLGNESNHPRDGGSRPLRSVFM